MTATIIACGLLAAALGAVSTADAATSRDEMLRAEVIATKKAFAKTLADRDAAGFGAFVSREAVFFSGDRAHHGRAEITATWARYFQGAQAPFSWEPVQAEVLASGRLALTSGPVRDAGGKLIGTFTSIWRLEAAHTWRIVFDKGNDACKP